MDLALLKALNEERLARRACILVADLTSGAQRLVREAEVEADELAPDLSKALRSGKSGRWGDDLFLNVHLPPPRIVVIGAAHISQALAPMAELAGFDLEIIDPRTAFATPERFPGIRLQAEWPELVLKDRPLDTYCALVAVTHDPKIDDLPLIEAIKAGCFYIGALGSRKTHAKRLERLAAAGLPNHKTARIEAPIGLDIGASTSPEIAVAILGSVISAFRKRKMHAERRGETEAS